MNRFKGWLSSLNRPWRWLVIISILTILTLTAITVSATTWEYTNSPEFCGTVCHTMPPEYAAYLTSPHARVDCVDCHLGQDSFLLTVPRKAREIRHVVNALTQSYEPPIYVKSLRPARDTCEQCHNPEKFSSDTFTEIKRYKEDEENTEVRNFMVVKTGGGTQREGLGRGIHWHIENEVWYYPEDLLKQEIPYVKEIRPDGEVVEYFDADADLPPDFGEQVAGELRRMDCIDCHTRISHLFRSPADAMDDALARNQIDQNIPEIKRKGVELLQQEYGTTDEGLAAIEELDSWYQENHPDYYTDNQDTVRAAVDGIKQTFIQTVFPNMQVGWETHPNNIGHSEFPGCFRCHDGKHTSAEGQTVRLECNICHSIPEIVEAGQSMPLIPVERSDEPDSHKDSNWLARHRFEFNETCIECHDVSNPGGSDNSSFCANSGCHATEWKYVGLDAPAIRQLVEPPAGPGSFEPEPVPHPIGPRTDCNICHALEGSVRPAPQNHTAFQDQDMCTLCHEPTLIDGDGEFEPVSIPAVAHLIENHEDMCLDCHSQDSYAPFPDSHTELPAETCTMCHDTVAPEEEISDEDRPSRPPIPHVVEGWEDCLVCHQAEGIKPFPGDDRHAESDLEDCTRCHKPEE